LEDTFDWAFARRAFAVIDRDKKSPPAPHAVYMHHHSPEMKSTGRLTDQFKYLGIAAVFEVVSGHGSTRIAMGITGRDAGSF
jgi:hypothetical protein